MLLPLAALAQAAASAGGPASTAATPPGAHGSTSVPDLSLHDGLTIVSLSFAIDGYASEAALRRQLRLAEGQRFDHAQWEHDLQLLRNLGYFRRLWTDARRDESGGLHLRLHVLESWSLLPVFGYVGGSLLIMLAGMTWADTAGELVETAALYMRRDRYNLGRAFTVLPNRPWYGAQLELQLALNGALVARFPGDWSQAPAALAARYTPERYRWQVPAWGQEAIRRGGLVDLGQRLLPGMLTISGRWLLFDEEVFDLPNYPAVVDAENRGAPPLAIERRPLRRGLLSLARLEVDLGQVDLLDGYRFHGQQLRALLVGSSRHWGSYQDFTWLYYGYRGFANLGARLDLAWQLVAAGSSSAERVYQLSVGGDNLDPYVYNQRFPGLLTIRGLRASLLTGANLWYGSLEARALLWHDFGLWFLGGGTLQAAAFADAGWAWDGPWLSRRLHEDSALTVGAGLLFTALDLRYVYVNWYVARCLRPAPATQWTVLLTRPLF